MDDFVITVDKETRLKNVARFFEAKKDEKEFNFLMNDIAGKIMQLVIEEGIPYDIMESFLTVVATHTRKLTKTRGDNT